MVFRTAVNSNYSNMEKEEEISVKESRGQPRNGALKQAITR